ncbi:MAG: GEVED domain-containing protein [Hyphomicrobiales bacterium]
MKRHLLKFTILLIGLTLSNGLLFAQKEEKKKQDKEIKIIPYVDNNGYWIELNKLGLAKLNPVVKIEPATYTGSQIRSSSVVTKDSPDIAVFTDENTFQSESSVFINPSDPSELFNSNNSVINKKMKGTSCAISTNSGKSYEGTPNSTGVVNRGDPAVAIGKNGRYYIGYIDKDKGQGLSYSDDKGGAWKTKNIAKAGNAKKAVLDKNHLWIDNANSSPYNGYLYSAWTDLSKGSEHFDQIVLSRSIDNGETWEEGVCLSEDLHVLGYHQGVNINSGTKGEVYAIWATYGDFENDKAEKGIGFSRSLDGGKTWSSAKHIIDNIEGIRKNEAIGKNMRTNSFPVLAVDISEGKYKDRLYACWANVGIPGQNTGNDFNVCMIYSDDKGDTWSDPIIINQDEQGNGAKHFLPWITCDPETGVVSAIFYDDRNVGGDKLEVFCANSYDGGITWEDFKVSDIAFTPKPIPGLSEGYFGDYLGITARGGIVYPAWNDNRASASMTYVSPYETNLAVRPDKLNVKLEGTKGKVNLSWEYETAPNFKEFVIYRNGEEIATTSTLKYTDQVSNYGIHKYRVTARYTDKSESGSTRANIQYGDPKLKINTKQIFTTLSLNSNTTESFLISNPGNLRLTYKIDSKATEEKRGEIEYCEAKGGGVEHISKVIFGDINNSSGDNKYEDNTLYSTDIGLGESVPITIHNGDGSVGDYCFGWIDWNQNGEFESDEAIDFSNFKGKGPYLGIVKMPSTAISGTTRMRLRVEFLGNNGPCGKTDNGEVEDYTVNVKNWISYSPRSGVIEPGKKQLITLDLNSIDIDLGDYNNTLVVSTNATENSTEEVSINLNINNASFTVKAEASKNNICPEENVDLSLNIDPAGDYTYEWTSIPEGFTSTKADPTVTPTETTIYKVQVKKDDEMVTSSIQVNVNPIPDIQLKDEYDACDNKDFKLDAGYFYNATYLWSTEETTQAISVTYKDVKEEKYSVTVTSEQGCVAEKETTVKWKDCTDLEEFNENAFNIYPNPSSGTVLLAIYDVYKNNVTLNIYDSKGKLVLSKVDVNPYSLRTLNLEMLDAGVYTISIKDKDTICRKKFVLSK